MKTNIVKIEGNKIECIVDNEVKEYELADWVRLEYVKVGEADITISEDTGKVIFCSTMDSSKSKKSDSKDKKWEDDIVSFETLLTNAHNLKAPFSIKTECLKIDWEKKNALFKAVVDVPGVGIFEGHGDTTSENVSGDFIKPHFIRMAETRAIVRALRWYTNNGCAEEEK